MPMASGHRRHFAYQHMLLKTQYNDTSTDTCDICRSKLAGLVGYRCNACDFDVHEACTDYFKETISFFVHPWHTLSLSRMPSSCVGWVCDLCKEGCPPGCIFHVHPLCTMLLQTIRSPLHPEHDLCMVPSWGDCRACRTDLPVWHYVCGGSCLYRLQIACIAGVQDNVSSGQSTAGGQSNTSSAEQAGGSTVVASQSNTTTGAAQGFAVQPANGLG